MANEITETPKSVFRYIPSAWQSAGGILGFYDDYPDLCIDIINKMQHKHPDIELGILANAYTEEKDLKDYEIFRKPSAAEMVVYSDSGGLQIITRGLDITKEAREKIYTRQALHSDLAMAFDEIPLAFTGSATGMLQNNNKFFVDSLFQINGRATGKNIAEQIKMFQKLKTDTKILFILQGKDFASHREFAWFAFQEIKKVPGYEDYIGGLAIGNTTNTGQQALSEFILRFQHELEFLPKEWLHNVHILGAGTVAKIFSYFMVNDDYFNSQGGLIVSADSTTQTKAMQFGGYIGFNPAESKRYTYPVSRERDEWAIKATDEIFNHHEDLLLKHKMEATCGDTYREHYTQYNTGLLRMKDDFADHFQYRKRSLHAKFMWSGKMISDYLSLLHTLKENSNKYHASNDQKEKDEIHKKFKKILNPKVYNASKYLLKVNSYEEYMAGNESVIIEGHPYKTVLASKYYNEDNPVVEINGQRWITDMYQGELLGRLLVKKPAHSMVNVAPDSIRGRLLTHLDGHKIAVIKEDKDKDTQERVELDAW